MNKKQILREIDCKKNIYSLIPKEKLFDDPGCVHWSKMTGKMYGKRAIGRPMTARCIQRHEIDGCICQKCYATTTNRMYPNVRSALQRNRDLSPGDIYDEPPVLHLNNDLTWRSNWNGDYQDERDVLVDFAICEVVNYAICTAWTKNMDIVELVESELPSNYTVVHSNPMINCPDFEKHPLSRASFNIYTAEYAIENDIKINCIGACRLCKRCYGEKARKPKVVNELLKGNEIKYLKLLEEI